MPIIEKPMAGLSRAFMLVSLLFLLLAVSAPVAGAQEKETDFDPHPLRPADTSSPRDTLRSFLTNVNQAFEARRRGELSAKDYRAVTRALGTLDFSSTPHQNSRVVRAQRLMLMKEVLDRIELPPDNEIPGDREIADEAITVWTIPATNITIRRIEDGPRAGEFLFSAETVQQLERFYKQAKHLPYKPGVINTGFYEDYSRAEDTMHAREGRLRNRLKPVDTSSPRSTLEGFFDSVNRAHALVMEADAALRATPPAMTKEEAREIETTASNYLQRAISTLDLGKVPAAFREDVGVETVLQLKEIFDRMLLAPVDTVPDARMIEAAREEQSRLSLPTGELFRWRYPDTEIDIVQIAEGNNKGKFLFSAESVSLINDFYNEIREIPYRSFDPVELYSEYKSPKKSEGFYEYYTSTPGYLIAPAHFLGRFVEGLPGPFKTLYLEQAVWQWIGLLLGVLTVAVVAFLIFRVFRRLAARRRPPLDTWMMVLPPALVAFISFPVANFIDRDLNVTGEVLASVTTGNRLLVIAMAAWAVFTLCKAVAETVVAMPRIVEEGINATMLRIAARVVGFLIAAWIVIAGVQSLGLNMVPLIAGLGVGGLAVALAAKTTLANFIGSMILFANKPVRVGDFCRYGDQIGTVESIGLISTRIRSLERTIVTVPNAEFSEMKLDNFAMRDQRLLKTVLQLRYETTPEQMRFILIKLRELMLGHPMVTPDPARVRFVGYGAYSKDVEIFAYLRCQDQSVFLAIREDILLRMEDIINAAGSGFAFPSQTAYLARDTGLDTTRGNQAELEVQHLRVKGKLPFPEFEDEERERLEDILDYPPKGSPEFEPPAEQPTPPREPTKLPEEVPPEEPEGDGEPRGPGKERS